jgi:hypothetical protein
MALRKLFQIEHATVYRNVEYDEYVVKDPDQRVNPLHYGAGYFTNDLEDAIATAKDISKRWYASKPKTEPKVLSLIPN